MRIKMSGVAIVVAIALTSSLSFLPAVSARPFARHSQVSSSTVRDLTNLLNQFMRDAAKSNSAGFDKLFADDVIYTRSGGAVITKAELIKIIDAQRAQTSGTRTLNAEDVTIHEYGDTAVAAFRVVSVESHGGGAAPIVTKYRNTGTFLRRNGRWQVIAWQSTKLPDDTTGK